MKNIKKLFTDELITANFLSNLFYSVAAPTIQYILISAVGSKIIAFNSIVVCVSGVIVPTLWNKFSDKIYKEYGHFLIAETIGYIILMLLILNNIISNVAYCILDTFIFSIVSKNLICGNNKLKATRYLKNEREKFDNNIVVASNGSSLIGFTVSLLFNIPSNIAFILTTIGICIDNIFYFKVYKEEKCKAIDA
ncbi:hypothetical protein [Clostridium sp. 001]|uniref:hypothetical protein n=1 Tax=Clostridium sp. 001 TaxID=1970093 RepID=UPI001C2C670E|nr:hypothetical protein [Clostridium sp. 001]QXE20436.1 hypothetical protein B5S50_17205 [Clostridium sp. 001]